jgi:hypothetical protein
MFEFVSGANFFGEMVEWLGFAIAARTLPAFAFAFFTVRLSPCCSCSCCHRCCCHRCCCPCWRASRLWSRSAVVLADVQHWPAGVVAPQVAAGEVPRRVPSRAQGCHSVLVVIQSVDHSGHTSKAALLSMPRGEKRIRVAGLLVLAQCL